MVLRPNTYIPNMILAVKNLRNSHHTSVVGAYFLARSFILHQAFHPSSPINKTTLSIGNPTSKFSSFALTKPLGNSQTSLLSKPEFRLIFNSLIMKLIIICHLIRNNLQLNQNLRPVKISIGMYSLFSLSSYIIISIKPLNGLLNSLIHRSEFEVWQKFSKPLTNSSHVFTNPESTKPDFFLHEICSVF